MTTVNKLDDNETISIVTSLYKSAPYISEFYQRSIDAVNSIGCTAEIIFVEALKYMKRQAFVALKALKIDKIEQIQWVLTVPAIWSDRAKSLMEQWAYKAGMGNVIYK